VPFACDMSIFVGYRPASDIIRTVTAAFQKSKHEIIPSLPSVLYKHWLSRHWKKKQECFPVFATFANSSWLKDQDSNMDYHSGLKANLVMRWRCQVNRASILLKETVMVFVGIRQCSMRHVSLSVSRTHNVKMWKRSENEGVGIAS
jgi:acyl carrier protein phosphodiesterase